MSLQPKPVADPSQLTEDWITEALQASGVLGGGRVASVRWETIGTGKMGDNVRLEINYSSDVARAAPSSLVAKLPAADPTSRAGAIANDLYWRETSFYKDLAPKISVRTPRCYYAEIDRDTGDYTILMEDMSPALPGDNIAGCGPEIAELALREIAKLHAPFWGKQSAFDRPWIRRQTSDAAELGQSMLEQLWPSFAERYGEHLTAEQQQLGERFAKKYASWFHGCTAPRTLAHIDYRLENLLLGDKPATPIAVVDWQSVAEACGLTDVAYFIGGGMRPEVRREHERPLVQQYCNALNDQGVNIESGECWELYRRYSLFGILIMTVSSMATGRDERGDQMFVTMTQRHLQHGLDVGAAEFVA